MNKKKKKAFVSVIIVFSILLLFYICMSVVISIKAEQIIDSSWENGGVLPNELVDIISAKDYHSLYPWIHDEKIYNAGDEFIGQTIKEVKKSHTLPITIYQINTATTYYNYTIDIYSTSGDSISGSYDIHCKIYWKFYDGKWRVSGRWEHI